MVPSPHRLLIIPDVHAPYHDRAAWALMLKIAKVFRPHSVVVLGDFFDCYAVSDHLKDPRRERNLECELREAQALLRTLAELGASKLYFVEGNHEDRLARYISTRSPELHGLVNIKSFVAETGDWNFYPYRTYLRLGKVMFTHDLEKCGRFAVHHALTDAQTSIVIGHLHRLCYVVEGDALGRAKVAFCPGWLGDASKADYKHRLKANRDWALGFAVGYMAVGGAIHLVPIPIVQGRAVLDGRLFTE